METKIVNQWVEKGLELINSKGITCILRCLHTSKKMYVYQSISYIKKHAIYAYGGAKTHSLAQQKCMGETLERIALRLSKNRYIFELTGTAGAFTKKGAIERAYFELFEKQVFSQFLSKNISRYRRIQKKVCLCISGNKAPYTYMCIRSFKLEGKIMHATGLCTKRSAKGAKEGAIQEAYIETVTKKNLIKEKIKYKKYYVDKENVSTLEGTITIQDLTPGWYRRLGYKVWGLTVKYTNSFHMNSYFPHIHHSRYPPLLPPVS